ncbi:MAG TPA: hypothetical protein VHE99_07020 [Gammaproteobacteria bacterium]|nr:hypothetical protein [Gammaproteobacteria bacterium]
MTIKNKLAGIALATAVGLCLKGCASAPVGAENNPVIQVNPQVGNEVLCYGVNSCQGQSACKLVSTTCHYVSSGPGTNSCRGKGGVYMSGKECEAKGGVVPQVPL